MQNFGKSFAGALGIKNPLGSPTSTETGDTANLSKYTLLRLELCTEIESELTSHLDL